MARHVSEPSAGALGRYIAYPADAVGNVLPYWLQSGGTHVRLTGACKRALIATIEAIIERAIMPACCGSTPGSAVDFKTIPLDSSANVYALISLGAWATVANRAALATRIKRGCPKEDWELMVRATSALWAGGSVGTLCGDVMFWQVGPVSVSTNGFLDEDDLSDASVYWDRVLDCSSTPADLAAELDGVPETRPWGAYPGGAWAISDSATYWISMTLEALGASAAVPSGSYDGERFVDDIMDRTPHALVSGHDGNWFDSSSSGIAGQNLSVRRSSAAWAVLQGMLAQMRFTHLEFPYEARYHATRVERLYIREIYMDTSDGTMHVNTYSPTDNTTDEGTSTDLFADGWQEYSYDTSSVTFRFWCAAEDASALALYTRPADGWRVVGRLVEPFLTPYNQYVAPIYLKMTRLYTDSLSSVSAGNGYAYPAPAFQGECTPGSVTFVDRETLVTTGMDPDWTKWSIRQETGNVDLTVPVRAHANWLLSQLPSVTFPASISNPDTSALQSYATAWWAGFELYYPDQPNTQIDGVDAFFPTAIRNQVAHGSSGQHQIVFDSVQNGWKCDDCEFPFGRVEHAYPDFGTANGFGPVYYGITPSGTALASHQWNFQAMPTV